MEEINESFITDWTGKISEKVKEDLLSFYNKSLDISKTKINKSTKKISSIVAKIEDVQKLNTELNNLQTLCHGGLKWAINGFPKDMYNKLKMLENGDIIDNENLVESILFEAEFSLPNLFNKLIEKLKNIFPFNLFEKFENKVGGFTKKTLENISFFLAKVHAIDQPFYFDIIPAIIGGLVELVSEDIGESLLDFIPGIGFLLKTISILSYGLTIVAVIKSILKDFVKSNI